MDYFVQQKSFLGGKMNFKIGEIVKVVEEGHRLRHYYKEGQVVGFDSNNKERPLKVWFGRECDYLLEPEQRRELTSKCALTAPTEVECVNDPRTYNYAESELQKEPEWSMETLARRYFGGASHSYEIPKAPFVAGAKKCEARGCYKTTTRRIIYNFWGTVCFADVCDDHSGGHGKCTEEPLTKMNVPKVH